MAVMLIPRGPRLHWVQRHIEVVRGLPHIWVEHESLDTLGWYCLMCEWSDWGQAHTRKRSPKPAPGICQARGPLEIRRR